MQSKEDFEKQNKSSEDEDTQEVKLKSDSTKQYTNQNHRRRNNGNRLFKPKYVSCQNYKDMDEISRVFPHLKNINQRNTIDFTKIGKSYCYVLRSNNDDDIHKAIQYGIWTSLPANNSKLREAYRKAQEEKVEVFLFFTVNKSNQYCGVCRMDSDFIDQDFYFWWAGSRYKTYFKCDWVFIKDISFKQIEHISAMIIHGDKSEKQPVTKAIDGTELEWETSGQQLMEIFKNSKSSLSIFNDFSYMDDREQFLRSTRSSFGNNSNGMNNLSNGNRGGDRRNYNYNGNNNGAVAMNQAYGSQYQMNYGNGYYPYPYYPINYPVDQTGGFYQNSAQKGVQSIYPPNYQNMNYYPPGSKPLVSNSAAFYSQGEINNLTTAKVEENSNNLTKSKSE